MGKVLVSKFNGSSANNSLPKLNTIYLDYIGGSNNVKIVISAGDESVDVSFKKTMHINTAEGTSFTETTVSANGTLIAVGAVSELGTDPITQFCKITGGIYRLKRLLCFDYSGIISVKERYCGVKSLAYSNIMCYGFSEMNPEDIPDSIQYLTLSKKDYDTLPVSYLKNTSIQEVRGFANKLFIDITNEGANYSSFLVFRVGIIGNVLNLPYNTRYISYPTSGTEGNLEDFVASARNNGRASGCLAIAKSSAWTNLKLNNSKLSDQAETIPDVNGIWYLVWDSSSISWATSQPLDMGQYVTAKQPYNWTPYIVE